jgi:cation diffusion facilitator CzcD-associated flavoprotein CzcO
VGAKWDEATVEWAVDVENKISKTLLQQRYDFLINASGILNSWKWPAIPGIESFRGNLVHSAAWDEKLDLTGKHVGLIGNG